MCGIAGFVSPNSFSGDTLRKVALQMGDQLEHRGPDAEGCWTDQDAGVALSHRRLSIVDLSEAGSQPMRSKDGDWVIVYNGEIYNSEELRKELEPKAVAWNGQSDTETIIEAISAWGIERTVNRLVGMFAFALWHRPTRTLTLARDRMGIKPLYWSHTEKSLIFGSELKALRKHPQCPTCLNRDAIAGFLRNCYVNNPNTIYKGVNQLAPGWLLHWSDKTSTPKLEQYWSLENAIVEGKQNPIDCSDAEAVNDLENLLGDAVQRRMVADVPLGAFLSGGIDSSLVVAQMQKFSNRPVKTFSIGFEDPKYDESTYASDVASHLGTDHTTMIVTGEDALNVIPDLPTIFDEPFSDASQIPTYLLSKLTRQHVTVALSGDGGDELFAGYKRFFDCKKYAPLLRQPRILRQLEVQALEFARNHSGALKSVLPKSIYRDLQGSRVKRLVSALKSGDELSLYRSILSRVDSPADILLSGTEPDYVAWNSVNNMDFGGSHYEFMQYIDTLDYLADDILTKVDRSSMAVSLEARVPLIDHRIVEHSWRLPENMKVRDGKGKWILRQILNKHIPETMIDRPKKGFGVPIAYWLRHPLKEWANELLSVDSLKRTEIFKPEMVQTLWKAHLKEDANWEHHLWDILSLQAWALHNK